MPLDAISHTIAILSSQADELAKMVEEVDEETGPSRVLRLAAQTLREAMELHHEANTRELSVQGQERLLAGVEAALSK